MGTFEPGQAGELFALDGGVSLAIDLPPARDGNATAILLQPQQTPPVPLPGNVRRRQSDIAYVTGAGVSDLTEGHVVLRWNCVPRPAGFAQPAHYALLRYDDRRRQWQTQSATWIEAANILTAPISQPGHYVFVEIADEPARWRLAQRSAGRCARAAALRALRHGLSGAAWSPMAKLNALSLVAQMAWSHSTIVTFKSLPGDLASSRWNPGDALKRLQTWQL